MSSYHELVVHASAQELVTGTTAEPVDTLEGQVSGGARNQDARFYLNVTAAQGTTPTLVVDIYGTVNGVDYLLGSFTQKTAAIKDTLVIANCPRRVKAKWTIGGSATPGFTFELTVTRG